MCSVLFFPPVFFIISSRCSRLVTTVDWNYIFSYNQVLFIFTYINLWLVEGAEVKTMGKVKLIYGPNQITVGSANRNKIWKTIQLCDILVHTLVLMWAGIA